MNQSQTLSLEEVASLTGLPRRTVRYYIQIGLLDRPIGTGKGASYSQSHVERLLLVRKWQLAGLSLDRIAEVLDQPAGPLPPAPRRPGTVEVWSHLVVSEGIEIILEPNRAQLSPEQVRDFCRRVIKLYETITESGDKE